MANRYHNRPAPPRRNRRSESAESFALLDPHPARAKLAP
jgi:hypothetical protein